MISRPEQGGDTFDLFGILRAQALNPWKGEDHRNEGEATVTTGPQLSWFTSGCSNNEGGACVEVAYDWRKSGCSGNEGEACVEAATCPRTVHVRDSKVVDGPVFAVGPAARTAFLTGAVAG
ncbi:DUF397 domain-containing protein [Streptomyces sp. NPDC057486]|uniref:DUF397 domain-containing protein n=1 Tax=Streptomyces sp. NPDC057486 TaxID=3346145 RepID=UPI003693DDFE